MIVQSEHEAGGPRALVRPVRFMSHLGSVVAAAATVGCFSLLAMLVYVADEDPS